MMDISRTFLWRKLREQKILRQHVRVAVICEELIARYRAEEPVFDLKAKKNFDSDRIIWQYWAQGYENVPSIVRECLDSVEKYAGDYTLVRLADDNLEEYLDLPEFVQKKRSIYSRAHFSDLLRLALLKVYGGIWLDATVMLSATIPKEFFEASFFAFRRDPSAADQAYWQNTYAYYFGWAKGFRVNMLNSILFARRGDRMASQLCELMLLWWRDYDAVPDYFFFQILFDVYTPKEVFPLVSDTFPHYLQQSINDPAFSLMPREEIKARIPIHKLTYK